MRLSISCLWALAIVIWLTPAAYGADRVYWSNYGNGTISYANLDGTGGGGQLNTNGATAFEPEGLSIDHATGRIFWANYGGGNGGNGGIWFAKLNGSGGGGQLLISGAATDYPVGTSIDPASGRIYWANSGNTNDVESANLDDSGGGGALNVTGTNGITAVVVDHAAGKAYFTSNGKIWYANLNGSGGGQFNTSGATVGAPYGIAIDAAAGRLYWTDKLTDSISYANLDGTGGGGKLNTSGATLNSPTGLAIDPTAGRIYWVNYQSNTSPISYANLDGSGGGDLNVSGATPSLATFPVLLERPRGSGAPIITGGSTPGSVLTCSQGTVVWAADLPESFLWRAPQSIGYQWTLDGTDIAGATANSYTTFSQGTYACRMIATNEAGSTSLTSASYTVGSTTTTGTGTGTGTGAGTATGTGTVPGTGSTSMGTGTTPKVTDLIQSHRRWRAGNKASRFARAKRMPVGTTFSFSLNQAARVMFVFTEQLPGQRLKRRCVTPTTKNRGRAACKRTVTQGGLSFTGHSGVNEVFFDGRISRTTKLKPGRYTLVVTAFTSAGHSRPKTLSFTIVT